MIIPYTGFSYSWKGILTVLTGLALVYISYTMYRSLKAERKNMETFDNFKENSDFNGDAEGPKKARIEKI